MNSLYNAASTFKQGISFIGNSIYSKVYEPNFLPESMAKNLPPEILSNICSNFNSLNDLQTTLVVCKNWNMLINKPEYAALFIKNIPTKELNNKYQDNIPFNYQIKTNPQFLKEIIKSYHYNFFPSVLLDLEDIDKIKLQNDPDLMLSVIKRYIEQSSNDSKFFSSHPPVLLIGDELKKNQNFLNEALKYDFSFFRYLDYENQNKNEVMILAYLKENITSIQYLHHEFIENHVEHFKSFFAFIENNPECLKDFCPDFIKEHSKNSIH